MFKLVVGYFYANVRHFKSEGIFRLVSSDKKVRDLEIHLSQRNYQYLTTVDDPNVIANYLKRMLSEMKEPLIPELFFD